MDYPLSLFQLLILIFYYGLLKRKELLLLGCILFNCF
jgi:hypothetical protein